ncbi:Vta1 like-domain-containing protein [Neocallimastix lanati (nom. inval.)]|nr:Vta1 like-domain-containing protein [Neocallimastix sp. JGI-2020a]
MTITTGGVNSSYYNVRGQWGYIQTCKDVWRGDAVLVCQYITLNSYICYGHNGELKVITPFSNISLSSYPIRLILTYVVVLGLNFNFKSTSIRSILAAPGSTLPFDHFPVFPEQKGFRLKIRYCLNSGPEWVTLGIPSIWVHMNGVRHRKSIPRKTVLEILSNNMYGCPVGTISTKCCDYLNIPIAKELTNIYPIISYYCLFQAANEGIKANIKKKNAKANLQITNIALNSFKKADDEYRNGNTIRKTARTFHMSSTFFEIEKRIKYAKWKAADIMKAIREGRNPTPGSPVSGKKDLDDELSTSMKKI